MAQQDRGVFDLNQPHQISEAPRRREAGEPIGEIARWYSVRTTSRLGIQAEHLTVLKLPQYTSYKQDLIIGSLQVSVPTGQYDQSRLFNLGPNRWFVKPEVGVSKALGPLTLEFTTSATLYTANTNFFNGNTRTQQPIYALQGHAIYNFGSGIWSVGRRDLFRRRPHFDRRPAGRRPATELALRHDGFVSTGRSSLHSALPITDWITLCGGRSDPRDPSEVDPVHNVSVPAVGATCHVIDVYAQNALELRFADNFLRDCRDHL